MSLSKRALAVKSRIRQKMAGSKNKTAKAAKTEVVAAAAVTGKASKKKA